jgi:hypothetical protein
VVCSAGGVPLHCFTDLEDVLPLVAQEVFQRDSVEFAATGCRPRRGPATPLPSMPAAARRGARPTRSGPKTPIDISAVLAAMKL